jgi:adenylate cyclase
MAEERVQRRLAAILAADVAGYSRLMGEDEAGTRARFNSHLNELIKPAIASRRGRIVKTTGDALLVEFASVVDAVQCAVDIQKVMAERNASEPVERQIIFRIGVNLGDVIIEGDDIHGDGVNVAARLEALAAPGGVTVSGKVFEEVGGKLDIGFEDLGPQEVKNIAQPVPAYRVLPEGQQATAPVRKKASVRWRTPAIAAVVLVVIAAGGIALWQPWVPDVEPASIDKMAFKLPDRPSVAVLPFINMSGDKSQDYFADGMTEDLITDLSKVSGLFVVARNSSFGYKGKSVQIPTVAKELGVRYVLEGSIRKVGDSVRINAQLIDGTTGGHIWADRYDGKLIEVFRLQDKVSAEIIAALSVHLTPEEADGVARVHTQNLEAYELFRRATAAQNPPIPERLKTARRMFERVIELDPTFAGGYAGVSETLSSGVLFGYGNPDERVERALLMAQKAIAVDETFGRSYTALGKALLAARRHDEALSAGREAIKRQPNDAGSRASLSVVLGFAGQYDMAIEAINTAIRLNPKFFNGPYLNMRGVIQMLAGEYAAALLSFQENMDRGGPVAHPVIAFSATAYENLGHHDKATSMIIRLQHEFPRFTTKGCNFIAAIRY